jgi:hypothetical protein
MKLRTILAVTALAALGGTACERAARETGAPPPGTPPAGGQAATPVTAPPGPPPDELATRLPASEIRASLPPLPMVPFAPPRSSEVVRIAYEFAAVHPEVLKYVPCFCGCEQSGHQHNESCFVSRRAADGRVLEWDAHGLG